jgi:murein DD-endopeptidase MepM/ murein hydrolase activator NlpD
MVVLATTVKVPILIGRQGRFGGINDNRYRESRHGGTYMGRSIDRRRVLAMLAAGSSLLVPRLGRAQSTFAFGLPIGDPGSLPGDGFLIRHGFQTENTWYNPGHWHTAEDWYRLDGLDTAGAAVLSTGEGDVVFVGSDYPGRVIIIQHAPDLFSMYGHLDFSTVSVAEGDYVIRGQQIGTVALRTDGVVPSHLHFEIRNFLYNAEINGETPRYGYNCGYMCAPGPGYWPIDAPELPSRMGWRNPTHVIGNRLLLDGPLTVQVPLASGGAAELTSAPWQRDNATDLGLIDLVPGGRYSVQAVDAGEEASTGTSADAYFLSYLIYDGNGTTGWVRAAIADDGDTGSDDRPSSVRFALLPTAG